MIYIILFISVISILFLYNLNIIIRKNNTFLNKRLLKEKEIVKKLEKNNEFLSDALKIAIIQQEFLLDKIQEELE